MKTKQWHRVMVRGVPVFHFVEPVYYGKRRLRIGGAWYCPECDSIIDMRLLTSDGFMRKPALSGKYTSMFEKGLRFERKPRLSEKVVKRSDAVERNLPEEVVPLVKGKRSKREAIKRDVSELDKLKDFMENRYKGLPSKDRKGNEISKDDWGFAMSNGNYPCPCGSGKKYRKCHGI